MLRLEYKDYTLDFKFQAGTSRGVLTSHQVIFIKIYDADAPGIFGIGEAAPLVNLSPDNVDEVRHELAYIDAELRKLRTPLHKEEAFLLASQLVDSELPSLKMAVETALLDLMNGGKRRIFDNQFYQGRRDIPINGLVWMGKEDFMREQIQEKIKAGFKCIKMKIGAIDFEKELELLQMIRDVSMDLTIRVDANGAFPTETVFRKLAQLEQFGIHSIEQPIMPGQPEAMSLLCKKSPVPIALDEELIGVTEFSQKMELLKYIQPQYLILKPTLLGGFQQTLEWIRLADQFGIGWWLTSALESNVSLNAIAQFAGEFQKMGYQGLGTGQLYHNNIESPLVVSGAFLGYHTDKSWAEVF